MKTAPRPASRFGKNLRSTLAAALVLSAAGAVAAIPVPEKLLPDDTMIVLTAPDFARVREIYRTSAQTQLWSDPALKPFRDKFMSKLKEELLQPLERDLGVSLDDYANLPQGQVTLAMTQNGWRGTADQPPGFLLLLDARDKGSQLKTNLALLRRKWVDAGKPIRQEKIRDLEFTALPLSAKDVPPTLKKLFGQEDEDSSETETNKAPKSELVFGQFESLLIVGDSTRAVEKIVAHLTGGSAPSLGDVAAFEANRLAMFREAPAYGWVNVKAFVDLLGRKAPAKAEDGEEMTGPFNMEKIVTALGIGSVKTLSFNFQNSSEGMLVQFFIGAPESARQGLLKLFPAAGRESGPPPSVPAGAVKFQRVRIDGQKTWATLEKIVNDVYPGVLGMFVENANTAAKQKDPDFDIRKNLIGNLGDDLISYEKAPRGNTLAELNSPPSLFLLGSPRAEELVSALKIILGLINPQGAPAEREFLGRKIYSLVPRSGAGSADAARPTLSFAASGGYVAIATDVPLLEEHLRSSDSQQKTLRETPGLTDAATRVGGTSTGWFGYENQAETSRTVFEALRKGAATEGGDKMLAPGIAAFNPENPIKSWMDFSLWPPFEKIAKYFYIMVYTGSANADGISFKVFYPTPPQLRK